jgi:hypothetical protein
MVGGDPTGSLWTYERRELQDAIGRTSRLYADLYGRAIDALSEQTITPGALVIAGHCIRDLVNGLSEAVAADGLIPKYEDIVKHTKALSGEWQKYRDVLDPITAFEGGHDESASDALTPVPRSLILAARDVVLASRKGTANARRRYAALILGRIEGDDEKDPTVTLFKKSVDEFEKRRHPGRDREVSVEDGSVAQLLQSLERIENVMEGRLGFFSEALEDVMDVLDVANRREGPETNE